MSNYLFFYGATKENGFLSNFYRSNFKENDLEFDTVERYMHYHKALLFNDQAIAEKIIFVGTPLETKHLGRKVKNFDGQVWDTHKRRIVRQAIFLKFSQNKVLAKKLLETGHKILVEAAGGRNSDRIWGIGFTSEQALVIPTTMWGQNLLGLLLMDVREELRFDGFITEAIDLMGEESVKDLLLKCIEKLKKY